MPVHTFYGKVYIIVGRLMEVLHPSKVFGLSSRMDPESYFVYPYVLNHIKSFICTERLIVP